jgi:hypothetical protein
MNGMLIFLQIMSLEFAFQINDGGESSKWARDMERSVRGLAGRAAEIQLLIPEHCSHEGKI